MKLDNGSTASACDSSGKTIFVLIKHIFHPGGLEKQGLFLQVIPFPKCQTIKFLNTHFEDFLELFRGQMPLENENTKDIIKLVCAQEYFCPKF